MDVERNLRSPIAGIANRAAARGDAFHMPVVAVRTGDTPAAERARFQREPSDILITTPESLYLLLTSNAREALRSIDTVIIDEIHALVPTKRGAHLALSLERLRGADAPVPPQRIGSPPRSAPSTKSRASSAASNRGQPRPGSDRGQTGVRPGSDRGQACSVDPRRRSTTSSRRGRDATRTRLSRRSRSSTRRRRRSSS